MTGTAISANTPASANEDEQPTLTDVEFYATLPIATQLTKLRSALAPQITNHISDELAFRVLAYFQSIVVRYNDALASVELGQESESSHELMLLSQARRKRLAAIVDTEDGSSIEALSVEFRDAHEVQLSLDYSLTDSHNRGSVSFTDTHVATIGERALNSDRITCPDPEKPFRDAFDKDRLKAFAYHIHNQLLSSARPVEAQIKTVADRSLGCPFLEMQVGEHTIGLTMSARDDSGDSEFVVGVHSLGNYLAQGEKKAALDFAPPTESDPTLAAHGYLTVQEGPFEPGAVSADRAASIAISVGQTLAKIQIQGLERD